MSERIRRRRPEPRPSWGIPAWAVVLGLLAALGAGAWLVQTGGSPIRSRRISAATDYLGLVRVWAAHNAATDPLPVGLAEPGTPCRVLESLTALGTERALSGPEG